MKKLWHSIDEEPALPISCNHIRIACLVKIPVDGCENAFVTRIDTMSVFKNKPSWYISWKTRVKEKEMVKWCYWDDLVSENLCITE